MTSSIGAKNFVSGTNLYHLVGSMEVPSQAFLLFFLLPDWLKLTHLKSRMDCGFQTFFRAIFVPP